MGKNNMLTKIFEIVLKINEQGENHVFLNLSPHVSFIEIMIYEGGWSEGAFMNTEYSFYYDDEMTDANSKRAYIKLLELFVERVCD